MTGMRPTVQAGRLVAEMSRVRRHAILGLALADRESSRIQCVWLCRHPRGVLAVAALHFEECGRSAQIE